MENFYEILKKDLYNMSTEDVFSVYIDFPFCKSICKYCVYNTLSLAENENKRQEYVDALIKQIRSFKDILEVKTPDSLYFGGGTPSLFTFDELTLIKESIPNYHKIKTIKIEAHPIDLNNKKIEFYAKEMLVDVLSLGVQSLDQQSCAQQKRIWIDATHLKKIIEICHSYGILVNVDLVALFNGDEEFNWDIFDNDLKLMTTIVTPDIITSVVNYNTKLNYPNQVLRLRQLLSKVIGKTYYPANKTMLSTNILDIKKYRNNDHWIATKSYWEYQMNNIRYNGSLPKIGHRIHQATLSFGGANKHQVYSFPTSVSCVCYSSYNFTTHKFHTVVKHD